jgi:hypothetical protein
MGLALEAKKLAAEAREDFQDLAAEANSEVVSAEAPARSAGTVPTVASSKKG